MSSIEKHTKLLKSYKFNAEQIEFILNEVENFRSQEKQEFFDYDTYERDAWYTFNRSGLFEKEKVNKTGITNWSPTETRKFVTEI
jgi:hypothetical protein